MNQTIPTAATSGNKITVKFTPMTLDRFIRIKQVAQWRADKYWAYRLDEWLRSRYVESMQ